MVWALHDICTRLLSNHNILFSIDFLMWYFYLLYCAPQDKISTANEIVYQSIKTGEPLGK